MSYKDVIRYFMTVAHPRFATGHAIVDNGLFGFIRLAPKTCCTILLFCYLFLFSKQTPWTMIIQLLIHTCLCQPTDGWLNLCSLGIYPGRGSPFRPLHLDWHFVWIQFWSLKMMALLNHFISFLWKSRLVDPFPIFKLWICCCLLHCIEWALGGLVAKILEGNRWYWWKFQALAIES